MTPAEVYTQIRNQCAETSDEFWSDSEIYSLISVGESIIARSIGPIEKISYFTTTTGTKTYSLTSQISNTVIDIDRVTYDSYRLMGVKVNDMDNLEGMAYGGITVTGSPTHYYRYGESIGLSPTPDDAKKVELHYTTIPQAITSASTSFMIPVQFTDEIANYALYRMFLKDSELSKEASAYKGEWEQGLKRINEEWNRRRYRDQYPTVVIHNSIVED